eukprot:TRINITY_DN7390_c0_g1_i4.p1 TRINITY_DN7390_c0_g1~~TRINITY_DN7390_c0_g1_i4.p1  ORF type:complete len:125 (+),score=4.71 TRINITY_DN7390_c0_g1_i4:74-448(+)
MDKPWCQLSEQGIEVWLERQSAYFVEWVNWYLKENGDTIRDIVELSDGVKLIRLVEAVTQSKVSNYNRRPRFTGQKMDNINIAIQTLEREWSMKVVGVSPIGNFIHYHCARTVPYTDQNRFTKV